MKKKSINRGYVDIILLGLFIIIVLSGVLFDSCLNGYLPNIILINNELRKDLSLYVFSAQVSISTLGIALIAILAGVFKEKIYGINVLRYLTNDKPLVFKHKINIIIQLILIFVSYICTAFDKYNMLISIFFISIMITIIMVRDTFYIFKGNEYLKDEIYNYILSIFNTNKISKNNLQSSIIIGLKNDTFINIQENNTYILKENLNLFVRILESITNYNEDDKKIILELFEDSLSDIFNKIFKEKDSNKIIIALKIIKEVYKICNDSNKQKEENKTYLDIYEKVYYTIFTAIATVLLDDEIEQNIIISLQYELYNNMYFKDISGNMIPQNNRYLSLYSGRIYYELKRKGFEKYNKQVIYDFKKELFNNIQRYIQYDYIFNEFKGEKRNQIYVQLYQYTKVLIDNNEKDLLKQLFFKRLNDNFYNDNEYKFTIIIYIYYLIEFETLIDKEFKANIGDLVNENRDCINYFLINNYDFKFNRKNIENIKSILSRWEKMPEEDAKCMIMDSVIENFILLHITRINWNSENLMNELKPLVQGNEFSIASELNNKKDILQRYIRFNDIFLTGDIKIEEAEDKIHMLKYAISILYKEAELNKSKEDIKTEEEYSIIKNSIRNKTEKILKETLQVFNNKNKKDIINENVILLKLDTHTDFLDKNGIDNIIQETKSLIIPYVVMPIINKNLKIDIISRNDKNILVRFFELYYSLGFKTDTLIGYRDYFYGIDDIDKFRKFEENKIKLKGVYSSNCIITIDSRKLYFNIDSIFVEIKKLDIDEICKELDQNEKGEYMYNITNNIYIPFTKEELKIYLDNTRRYITIKANIEYSIKDRCIGSAIYLK